ncbi:MAG TPA: hypothetical protein DEB39_05250 [Planctomycetaceae bacterium]|nr:hypothetical protein [Planctomycetaceae bacterium]
MTGVATELKPGGMGIPTLVFYVAYPTERYYEALNDIKKARQSELEDTMQVVILKGKESENKSDAEKKLFLRTLSESLIANRYTFEKDFFSWYIKTASGAEEQISASSNHIVYGRRGSGKSTLLLYALHTIEMENRVSVWVDMQTYSQREDDAVIADVLCEILEQSSVHLEGRHSEILKTLKLPDISLDAIRRQLPSIKNCLIPRLNGSFIFLDDFHVVEKRLQPLLLDAIYSIIRGSRINIKISAIETFTTTYDANTREGMQLGHDIQRISLDRNLTIPDKTSQHIISILDSLARYCGIVSAKSLCGSANVLNRLVWTTAGVPRDALSVFSQALGQSKETVTVSDINSAALSLRSSKQKDMENDTSGSFEELNALIEKIRNFCFQNEKNAFLVRKEESQPGIMRLVDLRLLHIIHEGFTPHKAGEQYMAIMLDYGFYVSERISSRIKEFNPKLEKIETKELRGLPAFQIPK